MSIGGNVFKKVNMAQQAKPVNDVKPIRGFNNPSLNDGPEEQVETTNSYTDPKYHDPFTGEITARPVQTEDGARPINVNME